MRNRLNLLSLSNDFNPILSYELRRRRGSGLKKKLSTLLFFFAVLTLIVGISPFLTARAQSQPHKALPVEVQIDKSFILTIPKIGIDTIVTSNVDPYASENFNLALEKGAAHARGTALPDENGTVYIFGHSSDYPWNNNPHATLFLNLNNLEINDLIYIFYWGKTYAYRVTNKDVVAAGKTEILTSQKNTNKLILQTCWPPGTDWQRLIINAEPALGIDI